jgi:hypothetical protein
VADFLRTEYPWLPKTQRELIARDADEFVSKRAEDHLQDITSPCFEV